MWFTPRSTSWLNFYPRPPRGGRHFATAKPGSITCISIHALREEGDSISYIGCSRVMVFLSTPSARRATLLSGLSAPALTRISIHALREEGDASSTDISTTV